jgi:hypothetical protein
MHKALSLVLFLAACCGLAGAQALYPNLDDSSANWGQGCGNAIAGGTGVPTSGPTQGFINPTPSLDGNSMEISFTGQVLGGGNTTNCLWWNKVGANNAILYLTGIYHVYIPSETNIQALEYDQFIFDNGNRYMEGSQCVIGGLWQVWNQCTGWVNTSPSLSCSLSINTWHSIVWNTHRDTNSSTACGGHPCMYYDQLTIDGVAHGPFTSQQSCPSGDPDNIGIQAQIDTTSAGGFTNEFIDEMSLQTALAPTTPPSFTSANNALFTVGFPGSFTVSTGGTSTAALSETGALPTGVTFTDNGNGTATIAGLPLAGTQQTYTLTITAASGVLPNATQTFTLTNVYAPPGVHSVGQDNLYCPATNIPAWGSSDGPASLPATCYNTWTVNTPTAGGVVNVSTAAQLTTALAALSCGTILTLQSGVSFVGHFTIPAIACPLNNYVWIVPSALANLPPEGTRISPCYAGVSSLPGRPAFPCPTTAGNFLPVTPPNYMAQVVTNTSAPVFQFTAGTSGIRIIGLEITRQAGTGFVSTLIGLANLGNVSNIIFDRVWMHGDENQDETENAIPTSATSYVALIDSYFNNFYCISVTGSCVDSHVVSGGLNATNFVTDTGIKAVNNFLEAAGENFYMGGGSSNINPQDIEFRLNYSWKPLTWNPSDPSYNGGVGGHALVVKNIFEFKTANRALIEGNYFFNIWGGFTQSGTIFQIGAKNQALGPINACPICAVTNVTIRYNSGGTANSVGAFSLAKNDNGVTAAAQNSISVHDNYFDNLGYATCFSCGTNTAIFDITEWDIGLIASQTVFNESFVHNTAVDASGSPAKLGNIFLSGMLSSTCCQMHGITFTNNVMQTEGSGTFNSAGNGAVNCAFGQTGGANMITACWNPYTVAGNCFVNNGSVTWPAGNITSAASLSAVFTSYNGGNGGNYLLAAGACKGAGTDGLDPGANIAEVAWVQGGNIPWTYNRTRPRQLNSVQPPMPTGTNHTHYVNVLAQNNIRLTGQTSLCGGGMSTSMPCYFDTETGTGACRATINFGLFDSVVTAYTITNLLLGGVTEGGTNGWTPPCVYSQAQANAAALTWTPSMHVLPGDYICYSVGGTCPASGTYWQLQSQCSNSAYDSTCVVGTTEPNFATGGSPLSDNQVSWVNIGSNAPLLDAYCGPSYNGGTGGSSCYANNGNHNIVINAGTLSSCSPTPCTLTNLYQAEALTSELPFRNWFIGQIIPQVIAHYNNMVGFGYLRVGCTAGGECAPIGIGSGLWPWYGATAAQQRAQYLSYVNLIDQAIQLSGPAMVMLHDTNCAASNDCNFADQEALLGWTWNFNGISNNALDVTDISNLIGTGPNNCAFPLTPASGCVTGDWAYLCSIYTTNSGGVPFWCGLQTATASTPIDCAQGLTGPLFSLPAGTVANCPGGWIGDLPFLVMLRSIGVGSTNTRINVNNLEIYVNPPASGSPPTVGAGDILLALDPSYSTSSGAQVSYAPYQGQQAQAFFNWLFPINPPVDRSFVAKAEAGR